MRYSADVLIAFAEAALAKAGMECGARLVAEILVEADLMGHDTHGLSLLPAYVNELQRGTMSGSGEPEILRDHHAVAHWDGHWLSGVRLVVAAIDTAMAKARLYGIGAVSIRRAHHTACLQAYLERATQQGLMVMIASSDPASSTVAPFGGLDPVFGPDPIAVGIPTRGDPILIDMSSSITTNGMVARTTREGGRLNGAWLQDGEGNPTDDPAVLSALPRGTLLLAGGHDHGQKGYGLALTVEALSQGLSGHGRRDADPRWGAAIFVQVFDPAAFAGVDGFTDQTDFLVGLCHASRARLNLTSVRMPGEQALARKREALQDGLELGNGIPEYLVAMARSLELSPPQPRWSD